METINGGRVGVGGCGGGGESRVELTGDCDDIYIGKDDRDNGIDGNKQQWQKQAPTVSTSTN